MTQHEVLITPLKPDCTIISRNSKVAIFIEVTSPNDENLRYWRKKKWKRYIHFCRILNPGWQGHVYTVEVSSRGFVLGESFFEMCHALGITSKKNSFKDELSKTVNRSSFVIWLNRFNEKMFKNPVPLCDIPTKLHFTTVPDTLGVVSVTIDDIFPP